MSCSPKSRPSSLGRSDPEGRGEPWRSTGGMRELGHCRAKMHPKSDRRSGQRKQRPRYALLTLIVQDERASTTRAASVAAVVRARPWGDAPPPPDRTNDPAERTSPPPGGRRGIASHLLICR